MYFAGPLSQTPHIEAAVDLPAITVPAVGLLSPSFSPPSIEGDWASFCGGGESGELGGEIDEEAAARDDPGAFEGSPMEDNRASASGKMPTQKGSRSPYAAQSAIESMAGESSHQEAERYQPWPSQSTASSIEKLKIFRRRRVSRGRYCA